MVPVEGVEPPRLAALDPKSSVSANSTTRALILIEQTYGKSNSFATSF